MRWRFEPL